MISQESISYKNCHFFNTWSPRKSGKSWCHQAPPWIHIIGASQKRREFVDKSHILPAQVVKKEWTILEVLVSSSLRLIETPNISYLHYIILYRYLYKQHLHWFLAGFLNSHPCHQSSPGSISQAALPIEQLHDAPAIAKVRSMGWMLAEYMVVS